MPITPSSGYVASNDASVAIRAKVFEDLAAISEYAAAHNKCDRTVWNWIALGLPVTYIGRTPYVVLSKAARFWCDRARTHEVRRRGRPRKLST